MNHNYPGLTASRSTDARVVKTRAALREALLALLEQRPFDQITIRDITNQAGAGYATFFRHYETKWALLNDLASDAFAAILELAQPLLRTTETRAAALLLCKYVDENRPLWTALLTGGAASALREELIRQAGQTPSLPSKRGDWMPDDLRVSYGVGGMIEVLTWWLQKRRDFPVEKVAKLLDRLVIAPMLDPN